jgi:type IV secretion system protein TrbL
MGDLNVIDRFMAAFIQYIDSGFGLLHGDVAFLTTTLVGIDITLAGLFWAMGGEDDVIGRFLKKILYVGAFALIIGSFSTLADIIFRSFAGLGITAGGGAISADQILKPGFIASTGFDAAKPLLDQVSLLVGPVAFFENFLTIAVLMIAWLFVILAFFILAIQLFITVIEFKLTTLAGFILVPFALWNRTGFLAERVLGNVVSSGIKVMVLAVIVGIGSGFFSEFKAAAAGQQPDLTGAMSLVLASLSLLGLGIFGPGIASGLVSGAPQLGAGAAVGTAAAAVGTGEQSGALSPLGGGGDSAGTGHSLAQRRTPGAGHAA